MSEARGPMGLRKDLHIKALTEVPAKFANAGETPTAPTPTRVERGCKMFSDFVPMQVERSA